MNIHTSRPSIINSNRKRWSFERAISLSSLKISLNSINKLNRAMFVISFLIHVLFIELVFAGIQRLPSISLNEQSPIGTSIYELVRVYTTSTRPLTYSFLSDSSPHNSFFMIDSLTGRISIKRMIDREELCQTQICNCEKCILTLEIIASSKNIDILSIDITIENINDNQPNFPISTFDIRLSENTDVGHIASFPSATDLDYQSRLDYRLVPLNDVDDADLVETFAIAHLQTENQLGLRLLKTLDRERRQLYQMKILATDGELNGQLTLNVNVLDSNDNVPKFEHDQYHIKLRENLPVGNEILTVRALDNDEGLNAQINYTILNDSPTSLFPFEINSTTGVIRLVQALDYETETNYRFNVRARDNGPDAINVYGEVQIDIVDVNDCPPEIDFILPDADPSRIDSKQHRFFIEEEQPINTKLFHLSVSDKDSINDKITLKLLNHQDLFQLNEQYNDLYSLSIVGRLDREKQEEYFLHFQAKDRGAGTSLTSEKFLTIVLLDINDCAPIVDVHENPLKIDENKIIVGEILRIRANDFDAENSSNSLLEYSLLKTNDSDLFEINSTNGILKVRQKRSFDFETRSTYSLIVNVSDHGSKPKRLETLHEITISINDLNDNAPKFVEEFYEFHVQENLPIGTFIGRVKAIDFDSNSTIEYELEPNGEENFFSIDPKTGDLITKNRLDFETRSIHQLNVVANDNDHRHTSKVHVQINLIDLNDNAPIVESPTSIYVPSEFLSTNATTTIKIAQILAKDQDQNQNGTLTFSIADGNSDFFFQIDPSNGTISATTKYLAQGRHRLTVRVCDQPTIDQKCSNVVLNIQIGESIEKVFDESKPRKTEQILTREMVIVVLISTILTLVFSITMGILIACICKQKACRHLHRSTLKKPCQLIQSTDADKLLTSNSLLSTNKNITEQLHLEHYDDIKGSTSAASSEDSCYGSNDLSRSSSSAHGVVRPLLTSQHRSSSLSSTSVDYAVPAHRQQSSYNSKSATVVLVGIHQSSDHPDETILQSCQPMKTFHSPANSSSSSTHYNLKKTVQSLTNKRHNHELQSTYLTYDSIDAPPPQISLKTTFQTHHSSNNHSTTREYSI